MPVVKKRHKDRAIQSNGDLLSSFRKRESGERRRQVFSVHLHARTSQIIVLPLRHLRRLTQLQHKSRGLHE